MRLTLERGLLSEKFMVGLMMVLADVAKGAGFDPAG